MKNFLNVAIPCFIVGLVIIVVLGFFALLRGLPGERDDVMPTGNTLVLCRKWSTKWSWDWEHQQCYRISPIK